MKKIVYNVILMLYKIKRIIMFWLTVIKVHFGYLDDAYYFDLYLPEFKNLYKKIFIRAQDMAVDAIRKKSKIKIAFQSAFLSTWIGDEIVEYFLNDDRFEVQVVITWQTNSAYDKEIPSLAKHFEDKNIPYFCADGKTEPGDFDIVFFTSPYLEYLDHWSYKKIPLKTLICYTPYGFLIADMQQTQFNMLIHNICWRNFIVSSFYKGILEKYCNIGNTNSFFSGYAKLDSLSIEDNIFAWKYSSTNNKVKKIIYAPHHSIDGIPYYSTFAFNGRFMLECAKKYRDSTSWVFKAHPILRLTAVECGLFADEKEYDSYIEEWKSLPNAQVLEGEYMNCFITSDAMILDSVSFLAEYLYVNKPMLFLTRPEQRTNEFGELILDGIQKADGKDLDAIEKFIECGIDTDELKEKRKHIFSEYLDYFHINGMNASAYIYQNICNELKGDGKDE